MAPKPSEMCGVKSSGKMYIAERCILGRFVWPDDDREDSGPIFTKRSDVLPQDIVLRSPEIRVYTILIGLKFDRRLSSSAASVTV